MRFNKYMASQGECTVESLSILFALCEDRELLPQCTMNKQAVQPHIQKLQGKIYKQNLYLLFQC